MTSADSFRNNGLGYEAWAQRMVDEGKMFYPEKRSVVIRGPVEGQTSVARAPDGGLSLRQESLFEFSLHDIVCQGLAGKAQDYGEGKEKFCHYARLYAETGIVSLIDFLLRQSVCDGRIACDLFMDLSMTGVGWLTADTVLGLCESAFEALHKDCNGKGGAAKVVLARRTNKNRDLCGQPICTDQGEMGIVGGFFQAQFYETDDGF